MERATSEWVLFMDHDLFLCNRHWYQMCVEAINNLPGPTGWITAVTNRIGNPAQRCDEAPDSNDLVHHCYFAKQRYEKYGTVLERCPGGMSGFWILTNKTAWEMAGGFNEKRGRLLGVDNDYSRALSKAGLPHYRMPGLYVYHIYRQKKILQRW
jgi:GT2 family glycosyltransferase